MVEGKSSTWKDILNKRMSKNMPMDVFERIIWMKPMKLPDYLAFIKLGAVIMFNYPIASGVTVMESLSVGTPYVIYEGHSQGSVMRIEKGYLTALELEDISCCIAYTVDDFVDKLYRFGNDKEFWIALVQRCRVNLKGVFIGIQMLLTMISRSPQPEQRRLLRVFDETYKIEKILGDMYDTRRSYVHTYNYFLLTENHTYVCVN